MVILLIINFIISIGAIILFFILYVKMNQLTTLDKEYRTLLKEAEESISSFVYEMKEDNEKLLSSFHNKEMQTSENQIINDGRLESFSFKEEENANDDLKSLLQYSSIDEYKPTPTNTTKEVEEKSLSEQAVELKQKGLSTEEIAKKLKKGKTEIDLLLKFRQN